MKIAVLGTGGVGAYFGARLADAGYDVTFVARRKHVDAMLKNGLRISSARARAVGTDHGFKKSYDEETLRALYPSNYPTAS
jgi:ketopantoate reductase